MKKIANVERKAAPIVKQVDPPPHTPPYKSMRIRFTWMFHDSGALGPPPNPLQGNLATVDLVQTLCGPCAGRGNIQDVFSGKHKPQPRRPISAAMLSLGEKIALCFKSRLPWDCVKIERRCSTDHRRTTRNEPIYINIIIQVEASLDKTKLVVKRNMIALKLY